jgi:hypothetical protein
VLCYETKWEPNTAVILEIAVRLEVSFLHSYEEWGNLIYGEPSYKKGILADTYLENEDFAQYSFDMESDTYTFEDKVYESNSEPLEILLERKKAIQSLDQ